MIVTFFIYVDETLETPPRPFYVGKGSERRVKQRDRNDHWKRIADKYGHQRRIVAEFESEESAFACEMMLIALHDTFEGWGANHTAGGDGSSGYKHSDEALAKMSKPKSDATKAKMSAAAKKGIPRSAETKAKLSASHMGKTLSPDHREKLSASGKGRTHSAETRAKMSASATGKTRSADHQAKISAAKTGIPHSDATKAKMSKSQKGIPRGPHSAETRAKCAAATTAYYARKRAALTAAPE